jgi:hypothetical protein
MNEGAPPGPIKNEAAQGVNQERLAGSKGQDQSTAKSNSVKPDQEQRESRRGWASCFANEKTEDWHADFTGVNTLENGDKYWVNVFKRLTKDGKRFVSVCLRPWKGRAK